VAVRGAEPGDSIVAEILDVRPVEVGFACLIPGFGQLIEHVEAPVTRLFRVEDGWIEMNERVRFPARMRKCRDCGHTWLSTHSASGRIRCSGGESCTHTGDKHAE